jgi:hypothetical protein
VLAIVLIVIAALAVFAIAAAAVGTVSGRMATEPPPTLFDMNEAVEFVADRLPDEVTARLSYDDVRRILHWHIDYLEAKGLASAATPGVLLDTDDEGGPVVVADDDSVAWVIGKVADAGLELGDVDVMLIIEAELDYLRAIGAIGPSTVRPDE